MATALVTGGTSGIGNAFVRALAARGDDIVIVARDTARMNALAAELCAAHGIQVECLTADLARPEDVTRIADWIEDPAHVLDLVVNNAGFGLHAKLLDKEQLETQRRAMDVMCFAVLQLSGAAGRAMKARGSGRIINVSSTSAWIFSGNYSAIKAWVLSFTQALNIELKGSGVTATALCPGWVHTEFHQRAGISSDNLPGIVWVDPDVLVREALEDADAGKPISIPTTKWKIAIGVATHGPRGFIRWFSGKLSSSRHKK
ncbi:SDR family NAD(P)-dependent oxidoreductase [Luteococcus sp. H138]|uniref:SDR family NAD(P)-dependent oxidoreductase n=1 Tax=unclassified Luteococcus TaxID=2639923 RepID=UPI00313DC4F1